MTATATSTGGAVECRVGRLVEARLLAPRTPEQIADFAEALRKTFTAIGAPCVICADWRQTTLLAPKVADSLVALLRSGNAHFERSAILLPNDSALFTLQVERVIREASHPARRAFRQAPAMREWLAETLDAAETRRLHEFLTDDS
jgi:hypothetical protein